MKERNISFSVICLILFALILHSSCQDQDWRLTSADSSAIVKEIIAVTDAWAEANINKWNLG